MSIDIQDQIDNLFNIYLFECERDNTLFPDSWKQIVSELYEIVNNRNYSHIFPDDVRIGFNHLSCIEFSRVCRECGDANAFVWLKNFAKAWLNKEELPAAYGCCF